ncbi:MAG: hypothetical protein ABIR06_12865 [Cyclobacteriaceae bacterium]
MKTNVKIEKEFDAVKYMRQERDRISREIKDLTPEQQLEYFRKKSEEFRSKK